HHGDLPRRALAVRLELLRERRHEVRHRDPGGDADGRGGREPDRRHLRAHAEPGLGRELRRLDRRLRRHRPWRSGRAMSEDGDMTAHNDGIVTASRETSAPADAHSASLADPAEKPRGAGNDNLAEAAPRQRVRAVGDVFVMTNRNGGVRDNHVVAFTEGREIAWRPAPQGEQPAGHQWGWELEPL